MNKGNVITGRWKDKKCMKSEKTLHMKEWLRGEVCTSKENMYHIFD